MIKVHDNRIENEVKLHKVGAGEFFVADGELYRRCWWDINTFNKIIYEEDSLVCVRMTDGELVGLRYDQWVQPIADRQIELSVED